MAGPNLGGKPPIPNLLTSSYHYSKTHLRRPGSNNMFSVNFTWLNTLCLSFTTSVLGFSRKSRVESRNTFKELWKAKKNLLIFSHLSGSTFFKNSCSSPWSLTKWGKRVLSSSLSLPISFSFKTSSRKAVHARRVCSNSLVASGVFWGNFISFARVSIHVLTSEPLPSSPLLRSMTPEVIFFSKRLRKSWVML